MNGVSRFRLLALRATYLLIAVGLTLVIGPGLIDPPDNLGHAPSVVRSLLAGVAVIAAIGIRYPLQMLPLLLFELVWKSIWLVAFGMRWSSRGALTGAWKDSWNELLFSVILFVVVIPWGYVWRKYVRQPRERAVSPAALNDAAIPSN